MNMRRYGVTYEMQLTHNTPDGIMIYGPHAQTAEENREETTISSIYIIENNKDICSALFVKHAPDGNAAEIGRAHV